jgi:Family of unknown function (DUF6116)
MVTRLALAQRILRFLDGLRFPWLFLVACALFALDLIFPDTLPLIDELLLGLSAVLLGRLRKVRRPGSGA